MTVPIIWLSYRQPEIIARGTWDVMQFELIADRHWGTPPNPLDYSHGIGFESLSSEDDGAVVILGAQHHAMPTHVDRLNADLAKLRWVVLVLAGDECSLFPWADVQHQNMCLWIMTPRPHVHAEAKATGAFFVGEGYHHSVPHLLRTCSTDRDTDWFFAGQVTHERREQMWKALQAMPWRGNAWRTPGFLQGHSLERYLALMADAKVVPCPSGPCTPDSFRLYEALEAGCVPLADAYTPEGWGGYWSLVYGDDLPFPVVEDWSTAPELMAEVLEDWEATAERCRRWWEDTKRRMVQRLDDDVRSVRDA